MNEKSATPSVKFSLQRDGLPRLLETLTAAGYKVIGPTVRDQMVVLDEIKHIESLPIGWSDHQKPGSYRLTKSKNKTIFDFTVGAQAWKRFLFPPRQTFSRLKRTKTGFDLERITAHPVKLAFLGVRACELAAIRIQDQILMQGQYVDPLYALHRNNLLLVAVNCTRAGGTCFCSSMGTGPAASHGYDICLTELCEETSHSFVAEAGSAVGTDLLAALNLSEASADQIKLEAEKLAETSQHMGRTLETTGMKELLYRNVDNRRWDQVGRRCLTCGNCTMVCPTCFCATVDDLTDLSGATAERVRRWDSCFTMDYSYIHGGSVRPSARARYRQWMTHKLASWIDQFGTPGCVGCGRCITWCPVGIDITEELRAIRESDAGRTKISESTEVQNANA